MNDYLGDILVWVVILAVAVPVILAVLKRKRIFIFIFGLLIFLAAFPAAIMSEVSINGCCGAPSSGHEGTGYLIGGVVAIAGMLIMLFSKRLSKK